MKKKETADKTINADICNNLPIIDLTFKRVKWKLGGENIEKLRSRIDYYGVVVVSALDRWGDYDNVVIADVADGLYDAITNIIELWNRNGDYEDVEVYYTTKCEVYGAGPTYEHGDDIGFVLSSLLGTRIYDYEYKLGKHALCRVKWPNKVANIWMTTKDGYYSGLDISEEEANKIINAC